MFPLWDDVPAQRVPIVNYGIILACTFAFFAQLQAPQGGEQLVREFGMIPLRVTHPAVKAAILEGRDQLGRQVREEISLESPVPPLMTLFTCMFLHGGWMHIIGNMWFLFIFGDNVEDRFGHLGYLLMYVLSGLAAGVLHIMADANSVLPTIGASGAIAGVMGAYLLLHPHARVMALIPLGILTRIVPVPAYLFLVLWFAIQILSGLQANVMQGGVAWWAHVGGFVAGVGATGLMRGVGLLRPPPPKQNLVYGFPQYREERRPWD
jgi:membrane associated rhomboid family serine protease